MGLSPLLRLARLLRRRRAALHGRRDPQAGVTLLEMMVVLVIIAIVAVMVAPNVMNRPGQARVTVAKTDIRNIAGALEMYRLDNRAYPTTAQGLRALVEKPVSPPAPPNWVEGGYLNAMPQDPWGNAYLYESSGGAFELISYGADGKRGGSGLEADISSRDAR